MCEKTGSPKNHLPQDVIARAYDSQVRESIQSVWRRQAMRLREEANKLDESASELDRMPKEFEAFLDRVRNY